MHYMPMFDWVMFGQVSLAGRWNYSAVYDKSIKIGTLVVGIAENVLKIRGNLDRVWLAAGKGGIFQQGCHSDYKDYYWKNETKLTWYNVELPF